MGSFPLSVYTVIFSSANLAVSLQIFSKSPKRKQMPEQVLPVLVNYARTGCFDSYNIHGKVFCAYSRGSISYNHVEHVTTLL